jgi:hypothetical protein
MRIYAKILKSVITQKLIESNNEFELNLFKFLSKK